MKRKDEYEEIYLKDGKFGIEYTYKNNQLGGEQLIRPEDVHRIGISKCSEDEMFIRCGKCDVYMDYIYSLKGIANGKWLCPECGTFVKEPTVNRYISELEPFVDEDDNDYDEYY